jgi:hypothetical protein
MGDVYSLAHTVYIWLGPGDYQSDLAMEYLREVGFQENFNSEINTSVAQVRHLPLKHTWKLISRGYNYSGSWFWNSGKVVLFIFQFRRQMALTVPSPLDRSSADVKIY